MPLTATTALPAGVRGPVLFVAFSRFASLVVRWLLLLEFATDLNFFVVHVLAWGSFMMAASVFTAFLVCILAKDAISSGVLAI